MASYSTGTASAVLGVLPRVLRRLQRAGHVSFVMNGDEVRYDKDYIDSLALLLEVYALNDKTDPWLYELFALRWEYRRIAPTLDATGSNALRRKVKAECARLEAIGQIYSDLTLADMLHLPHTRIQTWAREDRITAFSIGRDWYVSRRYGRYLREMFRRWPTASAAAYELDVDVDSLYDRSKRQAIKAVKGPDGLYRFDPIGVEAYRQELAETRRKATETGEVLLTYKEAATRLGVTRDDIWVGVHTKAVQSVGLMGAPRLTESEVAAWEARFKLYNRAFRWLQPHPKAAGGFRPAMLSRKQAARVLGVDVETVSRWTTLDLLPYSNCSFSSTGRISARYPRLYIFGLNKFMGERRKTRTLAGEYKKLCQQKGVIV